jgi:hypothetical protein
MLSKTYLKHFIDYLNYLSLIRFYLFVQNSFSLPKYVKNCLKINNFIINKSISEYMDKVNKETKYKEEANTFSLDTIYSESKVTFILKDYMNWTLY